MNILTHPVEKIGLLRIRDGLDTEEKALAIKAALEDLPGVYSVDTTRNGLRLLYDPELASEQQFYEAVKRAGSRASTFGAFSQS